MDQNQGIQTMNLPQASIIDTIADQRDELRDENIRLKAHIKRLEKAGDDMYNLLNNCDEAYRWDKAKVPY